VLPGAFVSLGHHPVPLDRGHGGGQRSARPRPEAVQHQVQVAFPDPWRRATSRFHEVGDRPEEDDHVLIDDIPAQRSNVLGPLDQDFHSRRYLVADLGGAGCSPEET